ncbi:helix-hairpin-helix domain-containing protein [Methylobacterium isbiliense]|jgi:hypothetical protein|uniref:Helix-hairpin-helix domain-containing protein n=1 Tax=Methylobacterium isbiliense TaxID=315478 RepID=A0ABQ4S9R6_9HYPH|nr:helix-hairpin-helix domain-containing protein [Methylobacterium isbiliense]GJD98517.1 hypothetical protein GMJLKIPL_0428 [Methylobacterium isbiliense]
MLTGSAITRALIIVVLAAGLAGLWHLLMPGPRPPVVPSAAPPAAAPAPRPPEPPPPTAEQPARAADAGTGPAPSRPPAIPPPPPAAEAPPPAPPVFPPPVFSPPAATLPPEPPAEAPRAPAGAVDLNTASLAELNGLRGGGLIGKAIIAGRPYAAPQDLLSKRVLSRAVFERIKDQVTVR